jgi:hypothetical protein
MESERASRPADQPPPRIIVQPSQDPNWQERETAREQVRRLAWLLDSAFVIPGTNFRIGLDPILGLIPVLGDLISMAIGGYLIVLAGRIGVPRPVLARMFLNLGTDAVLGAVPVAGDVLDAAWRANAKNAALLERSLADPKGTARASIWYLIGLSALFIGITVGTIVLLVWLVRLLLRAFE